MSHGITCHFLTYLSTYLSIYIANETERKKQQNRHIEGEKRIEEEKKKKKNESEKYYGKIQISSLYFILSLIIKHTIEYI